MPTKLTRIRDVLLSMKLIDRDQLAQAEKLQRESPAPIGSILVSLGFLTEDRLLSAIAAQLGVSPWRLGDQPAEAEALRKVPGAICRTYQLLPVQIKGDVLVLAMRNPVDLDAIDLATNVSGMRIEPVLVDGDRLMRAIDECFGARTTIDQDDLGLAAPAGKAPKSKAGVQTVDADDRPIVHLVNQILSDAIRIGASDIHVEPRPNRVDVRYRVDGRLRKVGEIPPGILPMIVTRLKIMADLDIVEFRVPQDGRVTVHIDDRQVDLRVSVLPNYHGQRIVLRILDQSRSLKKLEEIGFNPRNLQDFRALVRKPHGLFLVTGPTGSGKTTTLYAALEELREIATNIMTCEDPVEYDIDGINQSQVNEKVGLTFATQLRATLRQDPDVILVGEIRDGETAKTAMQAAMTGHLVLSTLHCNDAASAIPRLLDMGVDPFLLSTSLIGVMSQRLVRRLCGHCRQPRAATLEERQLLASYGFPATVLWRPEGCEACSRTGYRARNPVHEIMPITRDLARRIKESEPLEPPRDWTIQHDALRLVCEGETSLEEARRIVYFESLSTELRAA